MKPPVLRATAHLRTCVDGRIFFALFDGPQGRRHISIGGRSGMSEARGGKAMKSRASPKDAITRSSASRIDLKVRTHPNLITFGLIDRNNFVALGRRSGLVRRASSSVCIPPVFGCAAKQSDLSFQVGGGERLRQTGLVA